MKKLLIAICVSFTFLANAVIIPAKAETVSTTYIEEVFEDGTFIEVTIEEDVTLARSSTKSGTKTKSCKKSNGDVLWSIKVHGTFSYDGTTASCTKASYTTTLSDDYWELSNAKSWKSGATAYASVVAKEYTMLGYLLQTRTETVSLTCSATGVLS